MIRVPLSSMAAAVAVVCTFSACSTIDNITSGDKVNYRTAKTKTTPLEVPPDLTQLSVDPRYAPQAGVISALDLQQAPNAPTSVPPTATNKVAPSELGDVRLERQGDLRYLSTSIPPDQLWPQLEAFWQERGLALAVNQADIGVMETEWSENRAKLSDDIVRRTVGRVFDSLYDTGERDRYRTRVERTERGTDIYITHRGMEEVYANQMKDTTTWKPRAHDPLLEGEMLSRLMIKLGAKADVAKAAVAAKATAAATTPARARALTDRPSSALQVDENFDRAWRRVGLALDRSGFTVEDRDRAQGVYFVRYVDPAQAGQEEPGFFARIFTDKKLSGPTRYRVNVKGEGDVSIVSVYDAKGQAENGEAGQRIVRMLVDDLK